MVQTVSYNLESKTVTRHNNAVKLPRVEKYVSQKNSSSNITLDSSKLKNKKNHCIKLQPLNAKVENNHVFNTNERKFSHQLNPIEGKLLIATDQKKKCSKIPVLQRAAVINQRPKNDNPLSDIALSAADRRQKFHQSRLRVAGTISTNSSMVKKQQNPVQYDIIPYYEGYIVHKIISPPVPGVNVKNVLPPIKPVEFISGNVEKSNQQKGKCLLGEITHFPALCNPSCMKQRKKYTSTIPHLPPILPPPAAPPPSISTSLEKDGNQLKEQNINAMKNQDWNLSKSTFPKLTAH